jgi:hypothetical protein
MSQRLNRRKYAPRGDIARFSFPFASSGHAGEPAAQARIHPMVQMPWGSFCCQKKPRRMPYWSSLR